MNLASSKLNSLWWLAKDKDAELKHVSDLLLVT